jgi:hypothetical protein
MLRWGAPALSLLAAGSPQAAPAREGVPELHARMLVRPGGVVRVTVRTREVAPAAASLRQWKEGKGPACVPARSIVGASLLSQNSVDLILRDQSRVRAKLESRCPALDYYYGFYITPTRDGMICADRDIIRSRMGGQCEIERFRSLQAVRR